MGFSRPEHWGGLPSPSPGAVFASSAEEWLLALEHCCCESLHGRRDCPSPSLGRGPKLAPTPAVFLWGPRYVIISSFIYTGLTCRICSRVLWASFTSWYIVILVKLWRMTTWMDVVRRFPSQFRIVCLFSSLTVGSLSTSLGLCATLSLQRSPRSTASMYWCPIWLQCFMPTLTYWS